LQISEFFFESRQAIFVLSTLTDVGHEARFHLERALGGVGLSKFLLDDGEFRHLFFVVVVFHFFQELLNIFNLLRQGIVPILNVRLFIFYGETQTNQQTYMEK
jgi:hypothetical protein